MGIFKAGGLDDSGYVVIGNIHCMDFDHKLWFELWETMWKNHCCVFYNHVRYVQNNITKPYKVIILKYYEQICEMFELAQYISPTSKKG